MCFRLYGRLLPRGEDRRHPLVVGFRIQGVRVEGVRPKDPQRVQGLAQASSMSKTSIPRSLKALDAGVVTAWVS